MVRSGLEDAARRLGASGVVVPTLRGQLLRPLFALATVPRQRWSGLGTRFWSGALAVQMVHEASLLHDDVLDGASRRRGKPTLAAERGIGAAVVLGDRYLTGAYRAATAAGSFEFVDRFAEAVERTVAGEVEQQASAGRRLTEAEYEAAIAGKAGELFGAAAAVGATVAGLGACTHRQAVGRAFGSLYQRIDDLLDYCHLADTGKPALQDYAQGKWSWVLDVAEVDGFGRPSDEVVSALFGARPDGPSAARRALETLRAQGRGILTEAVREPVTQDEIASLLARCLQVAEEGVQRQEDGLRARSRTSVRSTATRRSGVASGPDRTADERGAVLERGEERSVELQRGEARCVELDRLAEAHVRELAGALGGPRAWSAYFGDHARTFHLAARLFPPREAGLVTGLYAYCRFTDDLVDDPGDTPGAETLERRLRAWRRMSLAAYDGAETGIAVLDTVLADARDRGVSRLYVEALLDGVAMDLAPRCYRRWADLEGYTFCVAGAVGGWMTQLFGLEDPDLLERAHALGHAMQLTNIARDVGEDWTRGRVYLPCELLRAHDLDPRALGSMVRGERPIDEAYRAVVQALLARADEGYERAWPGIRALPGWFRRPVAAAAAAYRGIHREIRRNGYDNLSARARTSTAHKLVLAGRGLLEARRGVS